MPMSHFDVIIRGAQVVTAEKIERADVGISGETIAAIQSEISGDAATEIAAEGLHIFPGVIDAHVHFNEPGRTNWEGIATGSNAVAAGGGTMFFDMPLNAHPPTLDAASFELKRAAAAQSSRVDFALWGGLTPTNLDTMAELAECGVIGFKAFMCNSGIDDFQSVDTRTLREGMKRAAALRLPVAVHAESDAMTSRLTQQAVAAGNTSVRDFLSCRPIAAELEAIQNAIELAGETGCSLHIVHVSCAAGVRIVAKAAARGQDVTCETCPHYLVLTDEDMERLGPVAKCAPPLRPLSEQAELWRELMAGRIQIVGSDHSPSPPGMKQGANFFQAWGGISGAQHLLPLLLTRDIDLSLAARVTSANVARRFRLPASKGNLSVGSDADLCLVDLQANDEITGAELQYRHRQSPYIGKRVSARVKQTFLRGRMIYYDSELVGIPSGRLVKPGAR